MSNIETLIKRAEVHPQWQPLLAEALTALDPDYCQQLVDHSNWLPGLDNCLAAFRRDITNLKYVLIGESPYPRKKSANGIAFYDAAVDQLWSEQGLSKAVNRATSMRNMLKTMLLAEGHIVADSAGKISQQSIALIDKSKLISSMSELFNNLHGRGFLLLNATPVLHPDRKPNIEAKYWTGFLQYLLALLAERLEQPVTLILWGKIAEAIEAMPAACRYQQLKAEHPYNISFIHNPSMLALFRELKLLKKPD